MGSTPHKNAIKNEVGRKMFNKYKLNKKPAKDGARLWLSSAALPVSEPNSTNRGRAGGTGRGTQLRNDHGRLGLTQRFDIASMEFVILWFEDFLKSGRELKLVSRHISVRGMTRFENSEFCFIVIHHRCWNWKNMGGKNSLESQI